MTEFSVQLKKLLKENNITRQEFAKQINVSRQQVTNWCTGSCTPPLSVLSKIITVTGKDANFFFGLPSVDSSVNYKESINLMKRAIAKLQGE